MEQTDFDVLRAKLHECISEVISEEEDLDQMLSGWVLIYESVLTDSERSLTVLTSDATGSEGLPPWTGEGFLHHVARNYEFYDGDFSPIEDEDDD